MRKLFPSAVRRLVAAVSSSPQPVAGQSTCEIQPLEGRLLLSASAAVKPGALSGTVYNDANRDGIHQKNEVGLAKQQVAVLDVSARNKVVASMYTDSKGAYSFKNIKPGQYEVVAAGGWKTTAPKSTYYVVKVTAGSTTKGLDFEKAPPLPPPPPKVTIAGTVFVDANGNNKLDKGEGSKSAASVYVDINKDNKFDKGDVLATVNADGTFKITTLPAGKYVVRATAAAGYKLVSPSTGVFNVDVSKAGSSATLLVQAAKLVTPPPALSLVGDFVGTIKASLGFVTQTFDAKLLVSSQTVNSITGTITIADEQAPGTFKGQLNKDGTFTYSIDSADYGPITVSGKLSADGKHITDGQVSFEYQGFQANGTFNFNRV